MLSVVWLSVCARAQNLNVEEMETAAGNFNKKIGKLGRDIKQWKVGRELRWSGCHGVLRTSLPDSLSNEYNITVMYTTMRSFDPSCFC